MKMSLGVSLALLAIVQLAALPSVSMAGGHESAQQGGLEEIVVTAQKREQNLQDVGISITALTGDQIRELGYFKSTMVPDMAPGVMLTQPNSRQSYGFAIRGVLQTDFADHQEHPAAIYVDEAYVSQASGAGFQLFDLERVEILRGPQGTLWGRNATGGAVSFTTVKPSQETESYIEVKYGSYSNFGFEGAVGGALSDTVSARFSAMGNWHDPFVTNYAGPDIFDDNTFSGRLQLLWDINDDANLLLNVRGAQSENADGGADTTAASFDPATEFGFVRGRNAVTSNPLAGGDGLLPSIDCAGCDYFGWREPDDDPFTVSHDEIGFADLYTYGAGARLEWDFGNFDFVSITDFAHVDKEYWEDSDNTPTPILETFLANDVDQFSQEIRFSGETDRMRWVAGGYYLNIKGDYGIGITLRSAIESIGVAPTLAADEILEWELSGDQFPCFGTVFTQFTDTCGAQITSHPAGVLVLSSFWEQETDTYSFFGQTEYDVRDDLRLTTGIRYIQEQKTLDYHHMFEIYLASADGKVIDTSSRDFLRAVNPAAYLYQFNQASVGNLAKYDEGLWSAKVGLEWDVNDDTLAYFTLNRGVKGGGFNAPAEAEILLPSQFPVEEEVLWAYEVGFKRSLWDDRVRVNGSAFYYDYEDFQAFIFEGQANLVTNTDAEIYGAELEFWGAPWLGLEFQGGVAFLEAEAFDVNFPAFDGGLDRQIPKTPKWSVNGLVRYEFPTVFANTGFGGNFAIQTDFNYRTKFNFLISEAPAGQQPSYAVVNARISYTDMDDRWELAANVHNIADQFYATQIFDVATDFNSRQRFVNTPRWFSLSLRYNFQ